MNGTDERNQIIGYDIAPVLLSIGAGSIGLGFAIDVTLNTIRFLFIFFGATLFVTILVFLCKQIGWDDDDRKTKIDIERQRHGLALLYHEAIKPAEPQPEQPVKTVDSLSGERTSATSAHFERKIYTNPPPEIFIEFIFNNADKTTRRVPPERYIADYGVNGQLWTSTDSDEFLRAFDEQGITKKVYESKTGNAPRMLTDHATKELALFKFGHSDVDPTTLFRNPYQSSPA